MADHHRRDRRGSSRLAELFLAMIRGEKLSEEDLEDLDEAAQLQDISHMPARVKCAELAWRTSTACSRGKLTSSVCSESKVLIAEPPIRAALFS
ncbi:MAG: hypothetical protein ACLTYW_04980 [Collinsella sp.]